MGQKSFIGSDTGQQNELFREMQVLKNAAKKTKRGNRDKVIFFSSFVFDPIFQKICFLESESFPPSKWDDYSKSKEYSEPRDYSKSRENNPLCIFRTWQIFLAAADVVMQVEE